MKRRMMAILLTLTMLLAVLPAPALAATGRVNGRGTSISITDKGVMLNIKWSKVAGADGYEYAYNLFWKKGCKKSAYKFLYTGKTSASIRLKDYGTVDINVRAWKMAKGKRVYGAWTNGRLQRDKVDSMVVSRLKKNMKTRDLFLKAKSNSAVVRANPGTQYDAVAKLSRGDEVRATGSFKRDAKGAWWSRVTVSIDQSTTVTGWLSRKDADPVWY